MGPETLISLYMLTVELGWMVVPIAALITALGFATVVPLARAYARRMDAESRSLGVPTEIASRLERIERALDYVALEVERTKLLAEDKGPPDKAQNTPGGKSAQDRNK